MNSAPGRSGLDNGRAPALGKREEGQKRDEHPESDVPAAPEDAELCGTGPDFPDLSEVEVVRHYTTIVPVEFRSRYRNVSSWFLYHEIQSKDQ